jgi:hypothetical protein
MIAAPAVAPDVTTPALPSGVGVVEGVAETVDGAVRVDPGTISRVVVVERGAVAAVPVHVLEHRDRPRGAVDGLGNAFKAAFNWISENVAPIISGVVNALKMAFNWIEKNAGPALDVLKTAFVVAFAPIYAAFKTLQALLRLIGSFDKGNRTPFNPADPGSGLNPAGGFDGDPATPFAMGGIVTRPTLGLIGEAGPEAVIPLDRLSGMGGITINVQAGLVSTPDQIGQQIIEAIQNAQRRSGPVFAAA